MNTSTRDNVSHLGSSVVNYMLQLCVAMAFIAVQIVASAVVLNFSSHEKSQAHLRELIFSYAILCLLALVLLWCEYITLDQTSDHDPSTSPDFCFQRIILFETSLTFLMDNDPQRRVSRSITSDIHSETASTMELVVNWSRIYVNIFFGYWLVISGLEIRYETSLPSFEGSKLYWLTVLFFSYACFEHAVALMVFLVLRVTGAIAENEARSMAINALPVHRFKLKKDISGNGGETCQVCSICLGIYADNDELKELPCSHLLHKDCVDKWLKIKAACPLCNGVICRRDPI